MAGINFNLPSINSLIGLAISLVILFFVVKMLPENVRSFFRV